MILSIFPNEDEAKQISIMLLKERLAACVNIVPRITSLYWWEDDIQEDSEVLILVKTKAELETKVIEIIKANHSYDTPAIFSVSSTDKIDEKYMKWIHTETKSVTKKP